jgi:hypothetical protein
VASLGIHADKHVSLISHGDQGASPVPCYTRGIVTIRYISLYRRRSASGESLMPPYTSLYPISYPRRPLQEMARITAFQIDPTSRRAGNSTRPTNSSACAIFCE